MIYKLRLVSAQRYGKYDLQIKIGKDSKIW